MPSHISGKVIVVTGAGSGFGRLVSQRAAAAGAKVVAADINAAALEETVASIKAGNGAATGLPADVTDLAAMQALAAHAVKTYGAIDVMINNAGIMPLAFYSDHAKAAPAWDKCIDINIKGVLHGILAVHDQMLAQGRGHIINISSIYGNFPVVGAGVYGATKAAVNFLSESLRVESQGKIKVTIVKPTGVPGTGLSSAIVNPAAVVGILAQNTPGYIAATQAAAAGKATDGQLDPEDIRYLILDPGFIADQVIHAIDQPWGVSIGDITIRAAGDAYIL